MRGAGVCAAACWGNACLPPAILSSLSEQDAEISGGGRWEGKIGAGATFLNGNYTGLGMWTGLRLRSRLGKCSELMGDGQWDGVERAREVDDGVDDQKLKNPPEYLRGHQR